MFTLLMYLCVESEKQLIQVLYGFKLLKIKVKKSQGKEMILVDLVV